MFLKAMRNLFYKKEFKTTEKRVFYHHYSPLRYGNIR